MDINFIKLEEWNPKKSLSKKIFSMSIAGSRKEGKSYMIKHLYKKCGWHKYYDFIIVMTENIDNLNFYSEFVHGTLFFNEYDGQIIERMKSLSEQYQENGDPKRFLIILDDCLSNSKNEEHFKRLYSQGRHYNISIIFSIQQTTLIDTTARNNSDVIMICRTKSSNEKKSIIENFLLGTADDDDMNGMSENNFYRKLL